MPSPARTAAQQRLAEIGGALSGANADIVSLEGTAAAPGIKFKLNVTTLASAATVDIGNASTRRVRITGTATITSFGTGPYSEVLLSFTDAATLTHNPASLVLPGLLNIVTAAGDAALAILDGSGNWRIREYFRASGKPLYGIGTQDANAVAITGGVIDGTPIGATTPSIVNAVTYNLSGAKALERAGQYLAIYGPDGQQLFAGGSPQDGVRYFTGNTYLFRTNSFVPLAQFDANGLTVNANITHTIDNAFTFGAPDRRAAIVYAATGTINTSDAREKTEVSSLTDAEIAAATELAGRIGTFRFLQSVEAKGEGARLHIGMTVQQAMEIMEAHGLNPFAYAFICHDTWDAIPPTPAVEAREAEYDEAGVEIVPGVIGRAADPGREAGDRFGFRVDQLLLFLARGFDARLSALEARQG